MTISRLPVSLLLHVKYTLSNRMYRTAYQYMTAVSVIQQELSYRKQIAHKLRTQYADGIYRHKYYTVTLKCGLRSRSLKVVPFDSLGTASYSPSIVTVTVSLAILKIFSVKQWPDLENGLESFKVIKMARLNRLCMTLY